MKILIHLITLQIGIILTLLFLILIGWVDNKIIPSII